jgi:hypothetical protein
MESPNRRAELTVELAKLHEQQMESNINATFAGWNPEQTAEHGKRADRISSLSRELNALQM